jgi:hypothetical protein
MNLCLASYQGCFFSRELKFYVNRGNLFAEGLLQAIFVLFQDYCEIN